MVWLFFFFFFYLAGCSKPRMFRSCQKVVLTAAEWDSNPVRHLLGTVFLWQSKSIFLCVFSFPLISQFSFYSLNSLYASGLSSEGLSPSAFPLPYHPQCVSVSFHLFLALSMPVPQAFYSSSLLAVGLEHPKETQKVIQNSPLKPRAFSHLLMQRSNASNKYLCQPCSPTPPTKVQLLKTCLICPVTHFRKEKTLGKI